MNFLVIDHETTPYSDAHDYARYNLIKATAFSMQNVCDTSTFLLFLPRLDDFCSRDTLFRTHTLM
jgi:hypothetical protein